MGLPSPCSLPGKLFTDISSAMGLSQFRAAMENRIGLSRAPYSCPESIPLVIADSDNCYAALRSHAPADSDNCYAALRSHALGH